MFFGGVSNSPGPTCFDNGSLGQLTRILEHRSLSSRTMKELPAGESCASITWSVPPRQTHRKLNTSSQKVVEAHRTSIERSRLLLEHLSSRPQLSRQFSEHFHYVIQLPARDTPVADGSVLLVFGASNPFSGAFPVLS
jgi:hypothetical protein